VKKFCKAQIAAHKKQGYLYLCWSRVFNA